MKGKIPIIRVNYTIGSLLKSLFISEKSSKYRETLKQQIKRYFSVKNVVLTSSCRSAIFLLLKNLPQKKVIIPSYTCGVVVEAAKYAKKNIIFVDVEEQTLNTQKYPEFDDDTIIIATHQYGLPTEMKKLIEDARKKKAVVIEDCAGSLGSTIDGILTGTFGDYGVFSFSASKTLHAPTKGGFIISNKNFITDLIETKETRAARIKFKIKHTIKGIFFCANNNRFICNILNGTSKYLVHKKPVIISETKVIEKIYVTPFYEWQAYIVSKQFNKLNEIFDRRKSIAKLYNNGIRSKYVSKIQYNPEAVNIRYSLLSSHREKLIKDASDYGFQFGQGYEKVYSPDGDEVVTQIVNEIIYLPIGYKYNDREIRQVIDFINKWSPTQKYL